MNRRTKILIAAGVAAVVGTAGVAGAVKARDGHEWRGRHHAGETRGMDMERGMGRGLAMIEQFDTNKDGTLTQAEIDQARKDRLASFDTSKDGKLSLQEFEALWLDFTRQQMVRAFQRLDGDGDAAVTQEEYVKPTHNMVTRADRNNDGQLNQQDMRRRMRGGDAAPTAPQAAPPAAPKGASK
jgi:Ca2+-binding EF-hand superfamily protein